MKCDELKKRHYSEMDSSNPDDEMYYPANKVEEAIAELKQKLDLYKRWWKENDEIIAHLFAELRATRRALWLCRAGLARVQYLVYRKMKIVKDMYYWFEKQKKFRAKAEEYK